MYQRMKVCTEGKFHDSFTLKKLKEFDDDITETHMKRVNSLKNKGVINMVSCGMERTQSLKGNFLLIKAIKMKHTLMNCYLVDIHLVYYTSSQKLLERLEFETLTLNQQIASQYLIFIYLRKGGKF